MTTPTIPSVPLLVPPTAVQPGGKDADTGEPGGKSGAEEFASMVAGLVAALLGAPGSAGEARPWEATGGRGAQQKMETPAVLGPPTAPIVGLPAPDSPDSPDSGGVPGPSAPVDAPATQPESKPGLRVQAHGEPPAPGEVAALAQTRNLGRDSAPSEAAERAETRPKIEVPGSVPPGREVAAPQSGREVAAAPPGREVAAAHSGREVAAPHSGREVAAAHSGREVAAAHSGREVAAAHSGREVGPSRGPDAPATQPESPQVGLPLVAAPAAPASTAPVQAPAPPPAATAAQLVEPVASVHRRGPDGTHIITVDITPEALGPVRVEVELRDGTVELRLAGHTEATRDALRAALPDLRRALEAAGVGTGTFHVAPDTGGGQAQNPNGQSTLPQFGQPQHGGNPQNGQGRPAWAGPDARGPQPDPEPAPVGRPDGALDLQL